MSKVLINRPFDDDDPFAQKIRVPSVNSIVLDLKCQLHTDGLLGNVFVVPRQPLTARSQRKKSCAAIEPHPLGKIFDKAKTDDIEIECPCNRSASAW